MIIYSPYKRADIDKFISRPIKLNFAGGGELLGILCEFEDFFDVTLSK